MEDCLGTIALSVASGLLTLIIVWGVKRLLSRVAREAKERTLAYGNRFHRSVEADMKADRVLFVGAELGSMATLMFVALPITAMLHEGPVQGAVGVTLLCVFASFMFRHGLRLRYAWLLVQTASVEKSGSSRETVGREAA